MREVFCCLLGYLGGLLMGGVVLPQPCHGGWIALEFRLPGNGLEPSIYGNGGAGGSPDPDPDDFPQGPWTLRLLQALQRAAEGGQQRFFVIQRLLARQ